MMAKLIFTALFIAIATAATSNVDEILPEDDFQSAEALVETKVGGHWSKCGKLSCAKPTIYTDARICKGKNIKDCQFKKSLNGKHWGLPITMCSKWSGKRCETFAGSFNMGAKPSRHQSRSSIKWCHELTQDSKRQVCKCKGSKENWGGKGKTCFQGPNPEKTKVCHKWKASEFIKYLGGANANKVDGKTYCKDVQYKQGPWTPSEKIMGGCNDQGYAYSDTCAYPKGRTRAKPKPKKPRCECTVKGYGTSKTYHLPRGTNNGRICMYKDKRSCSRKGNLNKKSFHSISCQNCFIVSVYDDDDHQAFKKSDIHHMSCCGKKGCSWTAPNDFRDDVKKIKMYNKFHGHKCP
jgi:hypothetical protein